MAMSVNGTFDAPVGFTKELIEGQLYHEDLGEDEELWLIRMPSHIELSVLDKKKIFLSENSGIANMNWTTENGRVLECYFENCEIPDLSVVLPQRSDKKLHAVNKTFKGAILISEGLILNDAEIKSENEDEQKEDALNSIFESKGKKNKKKNRNSHNSDDNDFQNSVMHKKNNSENVEVKTEPVSMDWDVFPTCSSQK